MPLAEKLSLFSLIVCFFFSFMVLTMTAILLKDWLFGAIAKYCIFEAWQFEKFFVGKATEHLLGEGVRPEHLNDHRLDRVLDKLYPAGLTEVFVRVALQAARQFGFKMNSLHLEREFVSSWWWVHKQHQIRWARTRSNRNYIRLFERPSPGFEAIYPRLDVQWGWRYPVALESCWW